LWTKENGGAIRPQYRLPSLPSSFRDPRFYPAMQDPNEDTEWNDALRARGIIGPREQTVRCPSAALSQRMKLTLRHVLCCTVGFGASQRGCWSTQGPACRYLRLTPCVSLCPAQEGEIAADLAENIFEHIASKKVRPLAPSSPHRHPRFNPFRCVLVDPPPHFPPSSLVLPHADATVGQVGRRH